MPSLITKTFTLVLLSIALVFITAAKSSDNNYVQNPKPLALPLERVIDGDTFIAGGRKIRLWGIDAPEKNEEYYLASKLFLESILEESPYFCYHKHMDRYKRFVMQCFSKGKDVGSIMVRMGVARDYKKYSQGAYEQDETFAKENSYGIWNKE